MNLSPIYCTTCDSGAHRTEDHVKVRDFSARLEGQRKGTERVPTPRGSGKLVAMTEYNGTLYIACEYGLYTRRVSSGEWVKVVSVSDLPR